VKDPEIVVFQTKPVEKLVEFTDADLKTIVKSRPIFRTDARYGIAPGRFNSPEIYWVSKTSQMFCSETAGSFLFGVRFRYKRKWVYLFQERKPLRLNEKTTVTWKRK